ncbi:hypothetical protein L7F22_033822 [Adiantum nelumboides]|nr:hypothetical protein [Adiantum nelumboides]
MTRYTFENIPIFFGTLDEDVEDFLADFKMICHLLCKKGDDEKGELLLLCLSGNAEQWYWNISSQIGESYTRISKALKATFFKAPTMEQLWASIQMLHQIGDDYYADKEEFSHRWTRCGITSTLQDFVKAQQFIDGLSPFLKPKSHDVKKPYQQEDVVIKVSYPLQWFSSFVLTNDENKILNTHNDCLPTYDSSVEMCDEVSIGSFSYTSTTTSQHLKEDIANDIEYVTIDNNKSSPLENEMPFKVEQYLVQCDAIEDQDLKGNFDSMKNIESVSSLENESEEEEQIMDGVLIEEEKEIIDGGIDYLDHIQIKKEMDCLLQEKVEECEVELCDDDPQEMCADVIELWDGPCMLSMEEPTIVEAIENNQSSFEMVNGNKRLLYGPRQPIILTSGPFGKWGIDAIGPLSRTANGKIYILVSIEYMTRFGTPLKIISNNGPGFRKGLLIEVCEELKIQHRHSTLYYPQSNGLVEKANGIIAGIIRKMVHSKPKLWDAFLDGALWAYRTTYNDAIQFTPFHLVYGQEAWQPIDLQIPTIKLIDRE